MARHVLTVGTVNLYKRPDSRFWQCSAFLDGKNWRESTGEEDHDRAAEFAKSWFFRIKGLHHAGLLSHGKTFREAADKFREEYPVLTHGERSPEWFRIIEYRLDAHIIPFFEGWKVGEITSGSGQEYKVHRAKTSKTGKPPARYTILQEMTILRQVLATAQRHGWIQHVPDLSEPHRASTKVSHRAWFSKDEYELLYTETRRRAKQPPREAWRWYYEQLHDFVLFIANTGLRPDEAAGLEHRDVTIARDQATREVILEIEVRGKQGIGHCKSTKNAVRPYRRLVTRNNPLPSDKLFPTNLWRFLNTVLRDLKLKQDRDGRVRTAYSLRHTYICLRLMENADIYQIAKNCRTSVKMIERHYAAHLKDTLDAAAINRRRPRTHRRARKTTRASES